MTLDQALRELWEQWLGTSKPKPYRWGIVGCSKDKLSEEGPARKLYSGPMFRQQLAVAELLCERVVILSALLGVVDPDQVIAPYDRRIPTTRKERTAWAEQVERQLLARGFGEKPWAQRSVLCLAPESYWSCLHSAGWAKPLESLGIGQQKAKLKSMLAGEVA